MTDSDKPDVAAAWKNVQNFLAAVRDSGHILVAQGAFGWLVRGDLDRARRELGKLPVEKLTAVSLAAAALSSLADEVAAGS